MRFSVIRRWVVMALPLLFLVQPSHAFVWYGHALVCEYAYQTLAPEVRTQVDQLVKLSGQFDFPQACSWPDNIRDKRKFKHTKPWHYINVARGANNVLPQDCAQQGCVLSAIDTMQMRLRQQPQTDWQALLFLSHFVADIHQPLHVSYAFDRGGNRTRLWFRGERTSLHRYWDGELMSNGVPTKDERKIQQIPRNQIGQFRYDLLHQPAPAIPIGTPIDWANESYAITRDLYRHYRPEMKVSNNIDDRAVWQQRVTAAGIRLAAVLTDILAPPTEN